MAKTGNGSELEQDTLSARVERLEEQNRKLKSTVGTLINWLQLQLGHEAAKRLIDDLNT